MPQVHVRLAYFIFGGQAKRAVEFSLLRKSYSQRSLATASARSNNSFAAMRGHLVWRAHISNGSPVARIRSLRRGGCRNKPTEGRTGTRGCSPHAGSCDGGKH